MTLLTNFSSKLLNSILKMVTAKAVVPKIKIQDAIKQILTLVKWVHYRKKR